MSALVLSVLCEDLLRLGVLVCGDSWDQVKSRKGLMKAQDWKGGSQEQGEGLQGGCSIPCPSSQVWRGECVQPGAAWSWGWG